MQELQKKLQKEFSEEDVLVGEILLECQKNNWISDVRYAEEFIREKSEYAAWGPMKMIQKLREKGIEEEIIQDALVIIFPEEQQREVAQRLAEEKWKLLSKKTAPDRKAAVQRFLVSRGFSFPLILEATKDLNSTEKDLPEDPTPYFEKEIQ
jgi:regulatory protein